MDRRRVILITAAAGGVMVAAAVIRVRLARRRAESLPGFDRDLGEESRDPDWVIAADGARLRVDRSGDRSGPTVVLPHCWTCNRSTWIPVERRLVAAGCDVIRWDQRAHGESSTGSDGNTIRALGSDLAQVMRTYDVRDAVIAGHSMGGMTLLQYACDFRDDFDRRTKGIVLVDTAAYGLDNPLIRLAPRATTRRYLEGLGRNGAFGRFLLRGSFGAWAAPEHLQRATEAFLDTPVEARADFAAEFPRLDLRECIQRIDKPTTILVGGRDIITPVWLSRGMQSHIPGSELREIPRVGHMSPYEAPDVIADAILAAIVRRAPRPSPR